MNLLSSHQILKLIPYNKIVGLNTYLKIYPIRVIVMVNLITPWGMSIITH